MARFEFPDGRWLVLRPPSIGVRLLLEKIRKGGDFDEAEHLPPLFARLKPLTLETSWGGDMEDLSVPEVVALIPLWLQSAEDDVLPPVLAPSSLNGTPQPSSKAPTASSRRASASRSTSRSSTSPAS